MENAAYSDHCSCPLWAEAYFAMQDMKSTFHLPNSSLHNILCIFVCFNIYGGKHICFLHIGLSIICIIIHVILQLCSQLWIEIGCQEPRLAGIATVTQQVTPNWYMVPLKKLPQTALQ